MAELEITEERKLITIVDPAGKPYDKRVRGTVLNKVLGYTDDGAVIHVPTGCRVNPPKLPDGALREDITDSHAFVVWMLRQDPEGWNSSRNYKVGEKLRPSLKERLMRCRDAYPIQG